MPDARAPRGASDAATVSLHVGHDVLELALPSATRADVLRKPALPVVADAAAAVGRALDAPVASPPLAEVASGAARACVVVCDVTRPVPNGLLLRPIVDRLLAGGVPLGGITVLVATGLHRPNLGDELRAVIGDDWVFEHLRIENHDARDASSLVDLGRTPERGTPLALHRGFVEADVRVVTGLVEPHFMAGYSGGRKVVVPGIAGERTIRSLHASRFMADPLASTANLASNPLHEEQLAMIAMLGPVFAVNTVIDEARALAFVNAGEVEASHAEAVAFARRCSEVDCERPFDLIVSGAGGHPLDATYYQTVKAMVTPLEALADGGTLVVASSCAEGLGSAAFRAAQQRLLAQGRDAFLAGLHAQAIAEVDEWQTQMLLRATRIGAVHLWAPGLPRADRHLTGVAWCEDVAGFVADFLRSRPEARVAVLPEGPYVVPRLRPRASRAA
jgi:lactate racemase